MCKQTDALYGHCKVGASSSQRSVYRENHRFRNCRNRPGNALLTTVRIVHKHFAALVGRATLPKDSARPTGRGAHAELLTMKSDEPTRHNTGNDSKSIDTEQPANYAQACLARLPGRPPRVEASYDASGRFWLEDTEDDGEAYLWTRDPVDVEGAR